MTITATLNGDVTEPEASGANSVSLLTATALAVADMVGIGVFTSLGFQVQATTSPFVLMMLWVIGGIVAISGALCYAELAAAYPRSGGEYTFLSRIYHPMLGFLAGWISATVGFAAPVALAAMSFGTYFAGVVPGAPSFLLALALVWGVTLVQLTGVRHSSQLQNVSTVLKIALIVALIVAAFASGEHQPVSFMPAAGDFDAITSVPFAISLVFVLYAYSGWNASTYIAGEIHDPERTIPRAIILAALIVMALYVGLNAAFLYTTPIEKMSGQLQVAMIAADHFLGSTGGKVVGGLICFGLVSSVSAMMWIGPRVTATMGEDFAALSFLARRSAAGVPYAAILLQLAVVHALLFTQSFEAVLDYIQFSLMLCLFLTVLGMMVLRWREPELERPYRTWGYPVTPLVFLAATLLVMVHLVVARPVESLLGCLTILVGAGVYLAITRREPAHIPKKVISHA